MKALASPVRLRLIASLLEGERAVDDLAGAVEQSLSATSHNLRILRTLRLVSTRKAGRHVWYRLHDRHISQLLAAIRHHREHVHPPAALELPVDQRAGSR